MAKAIADLAHGVVAVDDDGGTDAARDAGPAARIDAAPGQLRDIFRHAQDAVAVDAAPVGGDQRVGQEPGVSRVSNT